MSGNVPCDGGCGHEIPPGPKPNYCRGCADGATLLNTNAARLRAIEIGAKAAHAAYRAEHAGESFHPKEDCPSGGFDPVSVASRLCPNCRHNLRDWDALTEAAREGFRQQARPIVEAVLVSPAPEPVATGEAKEPTYIAPTELLRRGGKWLGAARHWIQWNRRNGDSVKWGSSDELRPPITVREVEEIAAEVAATFWPEGPPPSVMEAAKVLTRWHYGPVEREEWPKECVAVSRDDWQTLQRAIREAAPSPSPRVPREMVVEELRALAQQWRDRAVRYRAAAIGCSAVDAAALLDGGAMALEECATAVEKLAGWTPGQGQGESK